MKPSARARSVPSFHDGIWGISAAFSPPSLSLRIIKGPDLYLFKPARILHISRRKILHQLKQ
jgi:hypothetical protein